MHIFPHTFNLHLTDCGVSRQLPFAFSHVGNDRWRKGDEERQLGC